MKIELMLMLVLQYKLFIAIVLAAVQNLDKQIPSKHASNFGNAYCLVW